MKKILIVLKKYKGGVGRVVESIKPLLEKKGYEVKVISREDDLNCYSLKDSFKILRKEVKERNYDILYSQDWSIALPLLFLKNHYCCYHGFEPKIVGRFIQKIIGLYFGKRLIVVGDKLKQDFPKSNIVYNGVNLKEFYDMGKQRKYLGWIQRDWEELSLDKIKELAKYYNLKLSIAKDIPKDEMNEWYNSLKVFVSYPKDFTGFNICWLEAKASGVPRILGNNNGIGIDRILNEPIKNFTWENSVNKLIKILR